MQTRKLICPLFAVLLFVFVFLSPAQAEESWGQCRTLLKGLTENGDRFGDTELGCIAADALREAAETDMALFPAGMLGRNMEAGPITDDVLAACWPQDDEICRARLSYEAVRELLEQCAAGVVFDTGNERVDKSVSDDALFPQISGFDLTYDMSGPAGDRVWSITPEGGERTRDFPADVYVTVAYPESLSALIPASGSGAEERLGVSVRQSVGRYIEAHNRELPVSELHQRVTMLGTGTNPLIGSISPMFWALFALVVLIFSGARYRSKTHTR